MIFRKAILGFSISIFLISLATLAMASSIELRWHHNTEADLKGYNLYYGHQPRMYSPPIPLGLKTEYTLSGLKEGAVYYIAITAIDSAGNESGFSEEISARVPPSIVASSGSHELVASTRPDRSNAFPLEGLQLNGNAYIFLDTQKTNITTVTFFIDGLESWTEKAAPYDLAGGQSATAFPFDTTQLQDGSHTIMAKINLDNGSTQSISAPFYVINNSAATLNK